MSHRQMNELRKLGEDHQEPRGKQGLLEVQAFRDEKMEAMPLSSSASPPSVLFPDSQEEVAAAVASIPPHSPLGACLSSAAMETPPLNHTEEACSISQCDEGPRAMEDTGDTESSLKEALHLKMGNLVKFLLLKYRAQEPTTKAEMLSIIQEHEDHFPELLREASLCLQLVFGVDVKEVDPRDCSYVLVNSLGLTYDGMGSDWRRMPKNSLLVMLLCVIHLEGDIVPEEKVWEALNVMGVHDGVENSMYGEPRELITKVWVQEQYVEYRQVANSDPARYEFLWGPRAYAETTKLKVLQFLFRVSSMDTRPIPFQSEEAESDEEERA
ncbi:melanoma-associated antigen 10-like [Rhinolophus ferrumequinum]|uniref:melanoma-associated antigen 10-like n=1 Tax=Rhinolophus ferrumequinum TaxID=59479 RepID=UPI00140FE0E4|nr:melanoma-associated antigen 10-like [Rhinolophus ferrumequinum]